MHLNQFIKYQNKMLEPAAIQEFFDSPALRKDYEVCDHDDAPAALPDASLDFLLEICQHLGIKKIFEFGSGRSTKALLSKGYHVTSLEDSDYWLSQTVKTLTPEEKEFHHTIVRPLNSRFLGLFPVMDWKIDSEIENSIREAELILVDSPYYTPFRESTLWSSLQHSNGALVIIDDIRIPTLKRFCDRLSTSNEFLLHARISVGHGFGIFYRPPGGKLHLNHSMLDMVKGWYRYFQGWRFYLG
jgi:hypothetical protein